jgi:hypothetical protein
MTKSVMTIGALSGDQRDTFRQMVADPSSPHGCIAGFAKTATAVATYRSKGANGKGHRRSTGFVPLTA